MRDNGTASTLPFNEFNCLPCIRWKNAIYNREARMQHNKYMSLYAHTAGAFNTYKQSNNSNDRERRKKHALADASLLAP